MNFETSKNIPKATNEGEQNESSSEIRYASLAKGLESILEEVYDFEIPESTVVNWEKLSRLMYRLDHVIDQGSAQERKEITQALQTYLRQSQSGDIERSAIAHELQSLKEIEGIIDPENQDFFRRSVSLLLEVTESIKQSEDVKETVKLTLLEGQISSKLYLALLPASFRENEKYWEMCNLLSRIARVGNAFDTAVDLKNDFQENQVKISPTPLNRAAFIGAALSQGSGLIKMGALTPKNALNLLRSTRAVLMDK